MASSGVPTVGPRGIRFRSRIEAKWAYIFEYFGWTWEYEPFDLQGYIPDFIVTFATTQVLVEVKGTTDIWKDTKLGEHIKKIKMSGWSGNYMIVGATYKLACDERWLNVGVWGSTEQEHYKDEVVVRKTHNFWNMGGAMYRYDIEWYPNGMTYDDDIRTGKNVYHWKNCDDNAPEIFQRIWTTFQNVVQWKGSKKHNYMEIKAKLDSFQLQFKGPTMKVLQYKKRQNSDMSYASEIGMYFSGHQTSPEPPSYMDKDLWNLILGSSRGNEYDVALVVHSMFPDFKYDHANRIWLSAYANLADDDAERALVINIRKELSKIYDKAANHVLTKSNVTTNTYSKEDSCRLAQQLTEVSAKLKGAPFLCNLMAQCQFVYAL
jgi:hypothetical protein